MFTWHEQNSLPFTWSFHLCDYSLRIVVILPPLAIYIHAVLCYGVLKWVAYVFCVSFNYRKFMKTEKKKHQLILTKGKVRRREKQRGRWQNREMLTEGMRLPRWRRTEEVMGRRRRRQTEASRLQPWEGEKFWTKGENDTLEEMFWLCSRECSVKFLFLTQ